MEQAELQGAQVQMVLMDMMVHQVHQVLVELRVHQEHQVQVGCQVLQVHQDKEVLRVLQVRLELFTCILYIKVLVTLIIKLILILVPH